MIPRQQHRIYSLQQISHQLSFSKAAQLGFRLRAKGKLAGQFQEANVRIDQEVSFTGDFHGFFQKQKCKNEIFWYFEGRIQNFMIQNIDGNYDDPRIEIVDENIFHGHFKGLIERKEETLSGFRHNVVADVIYQKMLEVKSSVKLLIPAFLRVQLKSITTINLEKLIATFSATMVISIQFMRQLMEIFYHPANQHKKIAIELNKDIAIQLPLLPGNYSDQSNDISCKLNKNYVMEYKVRRTFNASIDDHYGQFFFPFSLSYPSIVLSFQPLKLRNPFAYDQEEDYFSSRRKVHPSHQEQDIMLDFVSMDLADYLHDNLFTPYNQLLAVEDQSKRQDVVLKRATKISFSERMESGQYYVATNHLSLFTYHSPTLNNSNTLNQNDCWFVGLTDKNQYIVQPPVHTLKQAYIQARESQGHRRGRILRVSTWRHVRMQMPIYKYWVLNVIQIFIPIIVLAALSLFIFSQENGMKEDMTSTLNARIINVASILIAYAALIPMIRTRVPPATKVSFIYILIYLSILPHMMALISSLQYRNINNLDWQKQYRPFKDFFFLASFSLLATVILSVLIVVTRFIYASSTQYQVKRRPPTHGFISFEEATLPYGFVNYFQKLHRKRPNQFILREVDSMEKGNPRSRD